MRAGPRLGVRWLFCACAVFDEVLAQAKADPKLRWAALRLVRASAEGRAMEIDAEMLQPFRILEEAIEAGEMSGENSRVAAFLAIGRLGSPSAREYLDAITKDQFAETERNRGLSLCSNTLKRSVLSASEASDRG